MPKNQFRTLAMTTHLADFIQALFAFSQTAVRTCRIGMIADDIWASGSNNFAVKEMRNATGDASWLRLLAVQELKIVEFSSRSH